ncbi:MAG: Rrf2 family transcriptional regulator [Bacteroidales bacterium]|jgi:Rrf2 family protein|nr:Rrf2 family transcriptional regulator [Bacteroidales bacterium]
MNFSKTTEYALRILSFMVIDEKRLYTAKDIFESLNIPFRYLRKLLIILSKSELIDSIQGKNGGYRISKNLNDISLMDIVRAVGEDPISNHCFFGFDNCAFEKKCAMHEKWDSVRKTITTVLSNTTLDEIKASGPHSFISNNSVLIKNV